MKYVYHHLGLGDHIICNGMVRHLKEIYKEVTVFCKPHNYDNVNYMYRDENNINVLSIGEDNQVNNYILENNISKEVIRVGFEGLTWNISYSFDEDFYRMMGIPFEFRFSKFNLHRNLEKENEVYNYLNPNKEEFIFIHGSIDKNKIRNDLKIIENPTEFGIFDIIKTIEEASEVHIMESSIKCLINSYIFEKPSFFYHQYVRGYNQYLNSKGKNKFKIIY